MCTYPLGLFTITKTWKQYKCPLTKEWIKKMWYTHTHTHTLAYYSAIKKNETMPFAATWMRVSLQQPRDYHIKQSKLEKDKYYMISLIHAI